MLPEERDAAHLWDMLSAAREVRTMLQGVSLEQFQSALIVMRATERCIEIIGEAANKVSAETRSQSNAIPWQDISGMRNRLIHAYFDVDLDVVWSTVTKELPSLKAELDRLL